MSSNGIPSSGPVPFRERLLQATYPSSEQGQLISPSESKQLDEAAGKLPARERGDAYRQLADVFDRDRERLNGFASRRSLGPKKDREMSEIDRLTSKR